MASSEEFLHNFWVNADFSVATLNGETENCLSNGCTRRVFVFENFVLKFDSLNRGDLGKQCEAEAIFYARLDSQDKKYFAKIVQSGYCNGVAYVIQERVFGEPALCEPEDFFSFEERFGLSDIDSRNVMRTCQGNLVIVDYGLSDLWENLTRY